MKKIQLTLAILLAFLVTACAPTTPEQQFKGMTSEQIYANGEKAMKKGKYDEAIKSFEGLQAVYPFGEDAQQAELEIIYAYYKNGDSASALGAADRYIHLYPQSNDVDYAYYMKGLVNFERGRSWLQRKFHVSQSQNDLTYLHQSYVDFGDLLQKFPGSKYAPDARQKMTFIRNVIAQNDLDVAQYYFRQKAYVAAIDRATDIVQHFQGSPQVIDALVIMVQANRALGLNTQANEALRVLQSNYPNAPQLKKL